MKEFEQHQEATGHGKEYDDMKEFEQHQEATGHEGKQ